MRANLPAESLDSDDAFVIVAGAGHHGPESTPRGERNRDVEALLHLRVHRRHERDVLLFLLAVDTCGGIDAAQNVSPAVVQTRESARHEGPVFSCWPLRQTAGAH